MKNRVTNAGYGNRKPFLSAAASVELRSVMDKQIDEQVVEWYANVPAAAHLESKNVDSDYYKRNLIETAWRIRLLRVAEAKEGDIVFVSAAAGAVGSAVVQIAKAKGMTVIGAAGGPEKCEWVLSLGADAAIDYKSGPIVKLLMDAAPQGIDVYFDNVGGDHLDAALAVARQKARFAICGMIEDYNSGSNHAFRYVTRIIGARIAIKGFIYTDFLSEMGDFYRDMGGWIAGGQLTSRETVHEGIDAAPQAFLDLFSGGNIGKMLVRL